MMLSLVLLAFAAARQEDVVDRKASGLMETHQDDLVHDGSGMRDDDEDTDGEGELDDDDEEDEDDEDDLDAESSFEEHGATEDVRWWCQLEYPDEGNTHLQAGYVYVDSTSCDTFTWYLNTKTGTPDQDGFSCEACTAADKGCPEGNSLVHVRTDAAAASLKFTVPELASKGLTISRDLYRSNKLKFDRCRTKFSFPHIWSIDAPTAAPTPAPTDACPDKCLRMQEKAAKLSAKLEAKATLKPKKAKKLRKKRKKLVKKANRRCPATCSGFPLA